MRSVGPAVVAVAVALALLAAAGPLGAQAAATDVETQVAAVGDARAIAEAGLEDPAPERMDALRSALGRPARVELGSVTVEVPPDPVLSELAGTDEADFRIAQERLELLAAELTTVADTDPVERDALDAALQDAYREVRARPTLAQRFWRFAEDLLARLAEALAGAGDGLGIGAAVVLGLLSAAALWALARRLFVVADEHAPTTDRSGAPTPSDWRRMAEDALAAGDLDTAVRAQYRLLLHQLARRGMIRDAPSLTPAETRAAVARSASPVHAAVDEATAVFERMAYGEVPPDRDDVERMRAAVEVAAP